jgi:DNA repair photolyase
MKLLNRERPLVTGPASRVDARPILIENPSAGSILPAVQKWQGQGPVLHKNPFGSNPNIQAIHYVSSFRFDLEPTKPCPTRIEARLPVVQLMSNAAERLEDELSRAPRLPQAVYLCPHADPFPPLLEVQQETARIVEVLAKKGIQSWIMTRGFIRPMVLEVMAKYRELVKIMVALTTLDRARQRLLEPLSASPRLRLKQIRQLRSLGLATQAAVEPLLPALTDTRENLTAVLQALAEVGIQRISAGYLFLLHGSQEVLQERLRPHGLDQLVLDAYADGFERRIGTMGHARFLSRSRRQQGYARLMALAAPFGISVSVSALSNPDFSRHEPQKVFEQRCLPGLQLPTLASSMS